MTTWHELAVDNRTAAFQLFEFERWRSCVSRSYYAIYANSTQALIGAGVTMPRGQPNPSHRDLPSLIGTNLHSLSMARRWRLAGVTSDAYALRIFADYVPSTAITASDARFAIGLMTQAGVLLEYRQ